MRENDICNLNALNVKHNQSFYDNYISFLLKQFTVTYYKFANNILLLLAVSYVQDKKKELIERDTILIIVKYKLIVNY